MKRPLTGLAIIFGGGIWLESRAGWEQAALVAAVAGLLGLFLVLHRTRFSLAILLLAVLAAGMVAQRDALREARAPQWVRFRGLCDQEVGLRGIVVTEPDERAAGPAGPARQSFQLRLSAFQDGDEWALATGRVLVFVGARPRAPLHYGDEIQCAAILRAPAAARNPGTFDWRQWLAGQRIYFTASVGPGASLSIRRHNQGQAFVALSIRLRDRLERALRLGLEDEPAVAGVLVGMIIGERAAIPPDTYADFQRTGVFHVFAINGLHVGLVTIVILMFLRLLGIPRRWAGAIAIPLLALYVLATGAHPGAVRALVMASVWLIGRMLVRPADALNNLAVAALVILVWEPRQLFDGGFILSFTVVAAIVVLAPPIARRLEPLVATDPLLPRQLRPRWRRWIDRPLAYTVRLLSCSLAAWIGLLPLLASYFHLFTPLSIAANLLVLPLLSVVIALGLAAILTHGLWSWLALTFNNANFFVLSTMMRAMGWLGKIPHGYCYVQTPPVWLVLGYYGWLILLVSPGIPWARRRWSTAIILPALAAGLWLGRGPSDLVEITVLDLSDGAAAFVNLPGEQDDLLIDGGGAWSGERVVLPFLRAQGVDRLAAQILTCADSAHAAGLHVVARALPVAQAIHSGVTSRSPYYGRWWRQLQAGKIPVRALVAGETMEFGPGLRLRAVHPPRGLSSSRREDNTLVLVIEYGPTRVLWMSDATDAVERRVLAALPDPHADVIVRRGDQPACTAEFLAALRPAAVVLATPVRPDRDQTGPARSNQPRPASLPVYRTDELGAVRIRLTSRGYTIGGCLGERGGDG